VSGDVHLLRACLFSKAFETWGNEAAEEVAENLAIENLRDPKVAHIWICVHQQLTNEIISGLLIAWKIWLMMRQLFSTVNPVKNIGSYGVQHCTSEFRRGRSINAKISLND
jgi:hypothetical protein